jgi:hypothetical protein
LKDADFNAALALFTAVTLLQIRFFEAEADHARDGGPWQPAFSLRRDPVNPIPSRGLRDFILRMTRVFGAEADQARDGGPPSLHVVSTRELSLRRDPVNPIPSLGICEERVH